MELHRAGDVFGVAPRPGLHHLRLANIQGAPDLVVEILSPATAEYDRGYKQLLYGRHGLQEYWLVDPEAGRVEVLSITEEGLELHGLYQRGQTLTSPLLEGLSIDLELVFHQS